MLEVILISVAISIATRELPFALPNVKPFNCLPCLSLWIALCFSTASYFSTEQFLLGLEHVCAPLTAYLTTHLILTYESK